MALHQTLVPHASPEERAALGRAARAEVPRSAQGRWDRRGDRADPIAILEEQSVCRAPELVPLRYGRMMASPLAFFRGGSATMASDLATTPRSGLAAQICGDAHLANFGIFAAPDRSLVFDLNDFDETLPGPWEWDVKRLAASFEVAMRDRGLDPESRREAVLDGVAEYRTNMAALAGQTNLDVWYARLDARALLKAFKGKSRRKAGATVAEKSLNDARIKTNLGALDRLTATIDGRPRIVSRPPLVVPAAELFAGDEFVRFDDAIRTFLHGYAESLADNRRGLLDQYEFCEVARKVVGVGGVGMRSWIVLAMGRDNADPLFLQLKQAESSVLERWLGRSRYRNHARRVVEGQRLMQATSDALLGWHKVLAPDGSWHDFYVRQLWDGKSSIDVKSLPSGMFSLYARACAWTLARAHAKSGDRIAIAGYLGRGDVFDNAIADFASSYADQNESDYEAFVNAVRTGRIPAEEGV